MDSLQLVWEMLLGMIQLLRLFWPWVVVGGIVLLFRLGMYLYKTSRLSRAGIGDVDKMSGEEFERYLERLFAKLGYHVKRTPYQGDYGADLVLRRGNEQIAVQAKRYNKHRVGVKAVQEVVAAKEYYRCTSAMVVTNGQFSQQARNLAKTNRVELWDRDRLVDQLLAVKQYQRLSQWPRWRTETAAVVVQQTLPAVAVLQVCALCGEPVTDKVAQYCLDHREVFHGHIYCFAHQKDVRRKHRAG